MLTKMRFKNFKAWKDSGQIRLAPLTVLFGANSAGKTSIPQLLLLLKQTAESPDRQRALQFGDSRTLIDAGSFDDAIHAHDITQPLEVDFSWSLGNGGLDIADPLSGTSFHGDSLAFSVSIMADKRHQPVVSKFQYSVIAAGGESLCIGMTRQEGTNKFNLSTTHYKLVRHSGRAWPLPQPVRFYGFPDEVTAYYQNTAFASDLVLELERLLRGLYYVGPLREHPRRLYLWSGEVPDHVGARGDRAIEAILAAGERMFNFSKRQKFRPLAGLVAERLQSMQMISDFQVKQLGSHRKEYEVLVKTSPRMPEVKLTDVGFGLSQVLPVIVECFYVPRRSIVIFEQPEIHLHPRVQAELADLFVDAIKARENGVERECQFIVESHSEHFLRRLQRRIAEEAISKDDAALYFVHNDAGIAHLEELDVDIFGNILNWPPGFFGDEMEDLVARSEAQARRTT
jgi:predicted ATPase